MENEPYAWMNILEERANKLKQKLSKLYKDKKPTVLYVGPASESFIPFYIMDAEKVIYVDTLDDIYDMFEDTPKNKDLNQLSREIMMLNNVLSTIYNMRGIDVVVNKIGDKMYNIDFWYDGSDRQIVYIMDDIKNVNIRDESINGFIFGGGPNLKNSYYVDLFGKGTGNKFALIMNNEKPRKYKNMEHLSSETIFYPSDLDDLSKVWGTFSRDALVDADLAKLITNQIAREEDYQLYKYKK
jgi:hypothetical protein